MICPVLPMALEVRLVEPPTFETLACTVEADIELLIWLVTIGMFGALESASKLLPSVMLCTTALPPILLILALTAEAGSEALHFWVEWIWVRVGSVETLAPLQIAWLVTPTLPQTFETLVLMLVSMVALGPTIWLFCTRVLFMVVMSIMLPAAALCTTASPPIESMLPVRFENCDCRLIWPLMILLPDWQVPPA